MKNIIKKEVIRESQRKLRTMKRRGESKKRGNNEEKMI